MILANINKSIDDVDLQECYESKLRDPLCDTIVNSYKAGPNNEDVGNL